MVFCTNMRSVEVNVQEAAATTAIAYERRCSTKGGEALRALNSHSNRDTNADISTS